MSELSLNELMANKRDESKSTDKAELTAVVKQETALTEVDRQEIEKIKNEIKLNDPMTITTYGDDTQKELAKFSTEILNDIRTKDMGPIGDQLNNLVIDMKKSDIKKVDQGFLSKLNFIKKGKTAAEKYMARYEDVDTKIQKAEEMLIKEKDQLIKDASMMERMYEENLNHFKTLNNYIVAGEEKLLEYRTVELPRLQSEAESTGDKMALQVVSDFSNELNRFEMKLSDLKASRMLAIQSAPQIKLIANNDIALADKIMTTINTTIPTWRSQAVIALGLHNQHKAAVIQRKMANVTNELVKRNADALKEGTLSVAKETNRGIIEVDTLEYQNKQLISTFEETAKINMEGVKARREAEKKLVVLEGTLKEAVQKTITQPEEGANNE